MKNECNFDKVGHCSALREKDCYQCSFYKTKEQLEEIFSGAVVKVEETTEEVIE